MATPTALRKDPNGLPPYVSKLDPPRTSQPAQAVTQPQKPQAQAQPATASPVAQPAATAKPAAPTWTGNTNPSMKPVPASQQMGWRAPMAPLVNPSGAKIAGIAAPKYQSAAGPKINRLTGKPFGWRPGDPTPAPAAPYKPVDYQATQNPTSAVGGQPGIPATPKPAPAPQPAPVAQTATATTKPQPAANVAQKASSPLAQSWRKPAVSIPSPVTVPKLAAGFAAAAGYSPKPAVAPSKPASAGIAGPVGPKGPPANHDASRANTPAQRAKIARQQPLGENKIGGWIKRAAGAMIQPPAPTPAIDPAMKTPAQRAAAYRKARG